MDKVIDAAKYLATAGLPVWAGLILAIIGGAVGAYFKPALDWHFKQRELLRSERLAKIANWRAMFAELPTLADAEDPQMNGTVGALSQVAGICIGRLQSRRQSVHTGHSKPECALERFVYVGCGNSRRLHIPEIQCRKEIKAHTLIIERKTVNSISRVP